MVLVTGAAGLLGRELISELLLRGKEVTAIYNKTPLGQVAGEKLRTVKCDILDVTVLEEVMAGVEEVYHCAGKVSFAPNETEQLFKVNVEGTANVVNAALDAGVKKMVHVSSVAALGRIRENTPITEEMHWSPETSNSRYGQSKYLGEMEVWRGISEGLNAVIVNPVMVIGPGNWNESSTAIFKSVYNGSPWYTDGTTGFVDVKDVVSAMIMLMESDVAAERFIISAGNRGFKEVFSKIADAFQKKRPSKKVNPFLAAVVWRWEAVKSKFTGKAPLITRETARTALAKASFDNSKLKKFFPAFTYSNLDDSIRHTCDALQQKLNNH